MIWERHIDFLYTRLAKLEKTVEELRESKNSLKLEDGFYWVTVVEGGRWCIFERWDNKWWTGGTMQKEPFKVGPKLSLPVVESQNATKK